MLRLRTLLRSSTRLQRSMGVVACSLLLVGCSQNDPVEMEQLYREWSSTVDMADSWVLAPHAEALPFKELTASATNSQVVQVSQYWGFSDDTRLVPLPGVDEANTAELVASVGNAFDVLLAPHEFAPSGQADRAPLQQESPLSTETDFDIPMPAPVLIQPVRVTSRAIEAPQLGELSAEERNLLDLINREKLSAATGAPTDAQLDQQCRVKISAAYALSQRGAAYAAREELIGVLRLISQAKDLRDGTRSRTESLAAGLRALEESEDFVPRGSQLEAEMRLDVICAAHRTPLARELDLSKTLPSRIMERYQRYGQIKLAVAVAGEPAGSMALYSLGKLNSQLSATESERHPLAMRQAVAFQQAALLAHNENFMAAHELGVLLAETGHFPEAQHLLVQVATEQPNAVVYRNMARVQEALGNRHEAQLCRSEATRLAQQGRGPKPNVNWVSPQDFSRNQMNNFTPQVASRPEPAKQSAPAVVWR
jgi:tetratricopeptide (TPR) repeat protein